jgi:RimJ/RimL family protein N-acetyltransferase
MSGQNGWIDQAEKMKGEGMIYCGRVRLRAIEPEDLPRFVQWFNDPEVVEKLNMYLPMSLVEEERWYEGLAQMKPAERPLAIDMRFETQWVHIGSCGLMDINPTALNAELGISIGDKRHWDKGYGSEAMQALIRHAFKTLNLHRVYLRVNKSNPRAIKVYKRIGFCEEGCLREDRFSHGQYKDTLLMGILRPEWDAKQENRG